MPSSMWYAALRMTNIVHVDGSIDPTRDIETINLELIFSDIEILDRRIDQDRKGAQGQDKKSLQSRTGYSLEAQGSSWRQATPHEAWNAMRPRIRRSVQTLTPAHRTSPCIYAANMSQRMIWRIDGASQRNPCLAEVREYAAAEHN